MRPMNRHDLGRSVGRPRNGPVRADSPQHHERTRSAEAFGRHRLRGRATFDGEDDERDASEATDLQPAV